MGHAAQALLAPEEGPLVLRRPISPVASEACGKIAERLLYTPEWLRLQGVPEEDIEALRRWERASERARGRDILADTLFEAAMYRDPEADLDAEFRYLQETIAGVRLPSDAPWWAVEKNLAFEPLGRFDYLLARCAQAAVYRRLRALPGGLLGEEARRVLRDDVLAPAAGNRLEEWWERAAGTPPDCTAWLEDVAGLPAEPRP
jgi:hypothetical protein